MTTEEQIKYLGLDKLNALDRINTLLSGNFQVTGSLSLFEYGMVKRPIQDIDIVVESFKILEAILDINDYDYKEFQNYEENEGSEEVSYNRISFNIDGVKVCAFEGKKREFKVCQYLFDRYFEVVHPKYSIEAKKKFVKDIISKATLSNNDAARLRKHIEDIIEFYKEVQKVEEW